MSKRNITICSVLIVNWNSWHLLRKCLRALSKQTFRSFKVVVANNGADIKVLNPNEFDLPELIVINNNENLGFAEANNRLFNLASDSKYIALLNPDAFPEPAWLDQLISTADAYQNSKFCSFASRLMVADQNSVIDGEGDYYHISGFAWRYNHGLQTLGKIYSHKCHEIFSACAAAAMFRTDALIKAKGFDSDYFCYFEDVDLGFRLRLTGNDCLYVPSAVVHHVGSASFKNKKDDFVIYHGHRNLVWTYIKNMPGILFWLFLPLHILLNVFTIIWFIITGKGKAILRAKFDAVKSLPFVWRKRKLIQNSRCISIVKLLKQIDKSLIPKLPGFK